MTSVDLVTVIAMRIACDVGLPSPPGDEDYRIARRVLAEIRAAGYEVTEKENARD